MKPMIGFLSLVLLAGTIQAEDRIIHRDGKPLLGVTYPNDWKETKEDNHVIAISPDGQAWSITSILEGITDQEAGIAKIKEGLENYLTDIEYDEMAKTERGSTILSGTGKGKDSGVDLVFTTGVFPSGENRLSAIVFIIDADIEEFYKNTVLAICRSIRVESDFALPEQQ